MAAARSASSGLLVLIVTAALVAFAVDWQTDAGYAHAVAYVAVVLLAYTGSRRLTYFTATLCSVLTLVGYFLQPSADNPAQVLTNRLLTLFAIWVTAALCLRRQAERERQAALTQALDDQRNQLLAELKRQTRQREQMAEAGLAMNATASIPEVTQVLTDRAREIIGTHQAATSFTQDRHWAQAITGLSLSDKYANYRSYAVQPDGSGIYALVCETNQPLRLTQAELEAHPRWRGFGAEAARHPPLRGWLAVPLISRTGQNLGLIQLSDRCEGEFTSEDQSLLVQLAQLGSVALEVRRFQEELETRVQERTAEVRFLNDLLEQSTQPFVAVDFQGRLVRFNPAFEQLTGHSGDELLQMTYPQLTPKCWHEMERRRIDELLRSGTSQHYEKEYRCKDGRVVPIELAVDLYRNAAGQPEYLYAFVTDITERKTIELQMQRTAEELTRSNAELEQFAYIASHDLQEPLRKVRAFGDMLLSEYREALGEEGRDYLARMQNASKRMQGLINDLLTYSRVTTRGQPFEEIDLGEIVQQVLSDLEVRLRESRGRVEVGPLPVLEADPLQMRQLFQNLLGNALKFHRPGQPPVVCVSSRTAAPDERTGCESDLTVQCWVIAVADNGIGFEEKYLDRIFAPFQRLHGRGEYEGSGIGLAICRKIVERHGGRITAHSVPGQGSTFQVAMPVRQPSAP